MDKYVNEDPYNLFYKGLKNLYYIKENKKFKESQEKNNISSIQNESNYIAYQVSNIDCMLFLKLLEEFGIDMTGDVKNVNGKTIIVSVKRNLEAYLDVCKPHCDEK